MNARMIQPLGSSFTLLPCVSNDDATGTTHASSSVAASRTMLLPSSQSNEAQCPNISAPIDYPQRTQEAVTRRATISPFEPVSGKTVPKRRSSHHNRLSTKRYIFGLPKAVAEIERERRAAAYRSSKEPKWSAFQPPRPTELGRTNQAPMMRSVTTGYTDAWNGMHYQHHPSYAAQHCNHNVPAQTRPHQYVPRESGAWRRVSYTCSSTSRSLTRELIKEASCTGYQQHYQQHPCCFVPVAGNSDNIYPQDSDNIRHLVDLPDTLFIANGYTSVPKDENLSDDEDDEYYDENESSDN